MMRNNAAKGGPFKMKSFISILIFMTLTAAAMADDDSQLSADQEAAVAHGASTLGPILVCQLIRTASGSNSLILAENAINPEFGVIPNSQMKVTAGNISGLVTLLAIDKATDAEPGQAIVRLDLGITTEGQGAVFFHEVTTLQETQFTLTSQKLFSLSTRIPAKDGLQSVSIQLQCHGSRGTASDN
jgi:hypothetical protein